VEQLLSNAPDSVAFDGNYLQSKGLASVPPSVQRPRPPLTIAGQYPTVEAGIRRLLGPVMINAMLSSEP